MVESLKKIQPVYEIAIAELREKHRDDREIAINNIAAFASEEDLKFLELDFKSLLEKQQYGDKLILDFLPIFSLN
jgi:hypothetical protein